MKKQPPDRKRAWSAKTRASDAHREWYLNNKEKLSRHNKEWRIANPESERRSKFKQYGVTPEWYDQQLAAQNGRCAICGTTDPKSGGDFTVDHDHRCCDLECQACNNCRRGLLCSPCNSRLGALENHGGLGEQTRLEPSEKKAWIRKATAYIREYEQGRLFELPAKKPVKSERPAIRPQSLPELFS